jgi:hypothetical protein
MVMSPWTAQSGACTTIHPYSLYRILIPPPLRPQAGALFRGIRAYNERGLIAL